MTPQKQTIFSTKQQPTKGNCFSACIASVTDHPVEKVPVFSQIKDSKTRLNETARFLDKKGYVLAAVWDNPPKNWHEKYKGVSGGYAIVGGKSPRGSEYRHAVVYKDGKPFFDPHPSNAFLNGGADRVYIIIDKNELNFKKNIMETKKYVPLSALIIYVGIIIGFYTYERTRDGEKKTRITAAVIVSIISMIMVYFLIMPKTIEIPEKQK